MELVCVVEGVQYALAEDDVRRSPLLMLQAAGDRPAAHLPLSHQDFQLWLYFRTLHEPCSAALAIVMQVFSHVLLAAENCGMLAASVASCCKL